MLEGLADALQLDDAERAHLFDVARAANAGVPWRPRLVKQTIRPLVQRILDQIAAPATVRSGRLDYVGANALGRALYAPACESREQPVNSACFTFLGARTAWHTHPHGQTIGCHGDAGPWPRRPSDRDARR